MPNVKLLFLLVFSLFTFHFLLFASTVKAAEQMEPGGVVERCYVCDTTWRLASGDGTCPKDKEIKECKKDDDTTFGGCTGGGAVAGEICETSKEDKPGVSEGRSLFSPDNAAKLIPFGDSGKFDVSNAGKVAEFFENSSKPFVPTPTPQASADNSRPVLGINISAIFQDLVNRFEEFFARLFKGGIGTFQTIYVMGANPPRLDSGDVPAEFNRGTRDFKDSLLPANPNPFQDTSANVFFKEVKSDSLKDIISKAADGRCVPTELLMAISQVEGGHAFGYSGEEVAKFTTPRWQDTASAAEKQRGYCYNTCAQSNSGCVPGDNVMGAMQFNLGTWNEILPEIKNVLAQEFNYTDEPDRCNLRDSIVAASVKIKRDSGTAQNQCTAWDENTVKNKVARAYCGSCAAGAGCGVDYCGNVCNLYQSYSSSSLNK